MKAVGYYTPLPATDERSLIDLDLPRPTLGSRDLLVSVRAVSVNPVDVKLRGSAAPPAGEPRVLGFDCAGVIEAVAAGVSLFRPGDEVFYAGAIGRPGTNAELHAVDERLVGRKPTSLSFPQAAALPLTAITAWELLFERLEVSRDAGDAHGKSLLVIGAAGGVGSILVQLARQLTGLTVIGTASRADTAKWVKELGAHHVIDHSKPLNEEIARLGLPPVTYVASLNQSDYHWSAIADLVAPQGKIALIDDPAAIDVRVLKRKSVSLHWEFMFTRSMFETADMQKQHQLLNDMAQLVDTGIIKTTLAERFGTINATNLKRAHALIESNRAKGKIVLEGF